MGHLRLTGAAFLMVSSRRRLINFPYPMVCLPYPQLSTEACGFEHTCGFERLRSIQIRWCCARARARVYWYMSPNPPKPVRIIG